MNRREFLKGGLGGLFGAALVWAGVVKAEEAEPDHDGQAGMLVSEWVYGPPIPPMLSKEEKREAFEAAVISEAKKTMPQGGYLSVGSDAHIDDLPDGPFTTHLVYDQGGNLIDAGTQYWDGQAWDIKINGKEQVSDNVSWDYSPETGGAYPAVTNRDLAGWDGVNDWCDWPPKGTTWFLDEVHGNDANDGLEPETALLTREELYSRLCQEEIPSQDVTVTLPGDGSEIVSFQDSYYDDDGTLIALGPARNFQHNPDSDLGRLFSQTGQIDWPRTRAVLEEIGLLPRESATSDQAFGAIVESANKWNAQVSDNVSWDYSADTGGAPMTVPASLTDCTSSEPYDVAYPAWASRDGKWDHIEVANYDWPEYALEPVSYADGTPLKDPAVEAEEKLKANWYDTSNGKMWSLGDKGTARFTEDMGRTWHKGSTPDFGALRGAIWSDFGNGLGRWVYWVNDSVDQNGSDENGTGAWDDPVATEACAQSIADNPPFRV